MIKTGVILMLFSLSAAVIQAGSLTQIVLPAPDSETPVPWDIDSLTQAPEVFPAENIHSSDPRIGALFFKGVDYQGKETRAFAWIGTPDRGDGPPFPGMVLVHGAGGTAYEDWVTLWVDRGYAAIAVDTAGHIPVRPECSSTGWKRHEWSGPLGWGDFESIDKPVHDQWPYHAVAAVVKAHSLLRSFPEVDAARVGITGISWGGYLTCIAAGVDNRFAFAAPVYGCGFLGEDSSWLHNRLQAVGEEKAFRWLTLWDPSRYIHRAEMPMLFVNGTNDRHYRMGSWQKTYRLVSGDITLACRVRMGHSDFIGRVPEVTAFADALLKNGEPLPDITEQNRNGRKMQVNYRSQKPLQKAELNFTADSGEWPQRNWHIRNIPFDPSSGVIRAEVPGEATACFINLFDSNGLVVSSQHEEFSH